MADAQQALKDLALLVQLSDRMADEGGGSMYHADTLAQRNAVVRRLRDFIIEQTAALAAPAPSAPADQPSPDKPLTDAEAMEIHSMPWVRDCLLRYVDRPCDKEANDVVRSIVNAVQGRMVGASPAPTEEPRTDGVKAAPAKHCTTCGLVVTSPCSSIGGCPMEGAYGVRATEGGQQ